MKAWIINSTHKPYQLKQRELPMLVPQPGEILLRVAFAGLNRADLFQLQGLYPLPEETALVPGMECSGIVESVGANVTDFKPGERVCGLMTGGAYAEYATIPAVQSWKLPDDLSLENAAALPEALATIWLALFRTANFKPGETVLMHGGGSGIGTALIQVVKLYGGKVIVTAGTPEKCAACEKLGAVAINYREQDFLEEVKKLTDGKGVDIIIDIVGGEYVEKNLRALAVKGRMVSLSFLQGAKITANIGQLLIKNLRWEGITLRSQPTESKGEIMSEIARDLFPKLEAGLYKPIIDRIFPAREAEKALFRMQESLHLGKILLDMNAF